jgi:predicted alpha/beta hydrolase
MTEPSDQPPSSALPSVPSHTRQLALPVSSADGPTFELLCVLPAGAWRQLLIWLPAMGVSARRYLALAEALASRGVAVAIHEWRGIGSSNWRAGRQCDWSYRDLLLADLPATSAVLREQWPDADRWLGGHSLGGQLGSLYASMHPDSYRGLALVASGAPYWRCFRRGWLIGTAYAVVPLLAALVGHLPGRRIGFGGNEARGVIGDWSRSGCSGIYTATGIDRTFEPLLAQLDLPLLALRLSDDWLGPAASLDWLLGKMPLAQRHVEVVTADDLDGPADHFSWMKAPAVIAERIVRWMAGHIDA